MKKVLFNASIYRHLVAFHIPFMELLMNKGYEVHASGSNLDGGKEELKKLSIITHDISYKRNPLNSSNIKAYYSIKKIIDRNDFSFIHTHTPVASFIVRMAARKSKSKMVYTAHGFHFFKGAPLINWLVYYLLERIASRWTDILIVMNKEDMVMAEKKLGFVPNKSLFYTHGVGVDFNHYGVTEEAKEIIIEDKKIIKKQNNKCYFINIGDFIKRKRQIILIKTWEKFIISNKNSHLIFVGVGPELEKCKKYVFDNHIENISFLGYRHDIPKLLSFSDVGVLISAHEGLPRCVMEMMAAGKAVIGTDVRGTNDLIDNNVNGILVKLDREKEILNALLVLSKDKNYRIKLGESGRKKIIDYGINNVLEELELIYNNVIE